MQQIPRFCAIGFLLLTAFNLSFTLLSPPPQNVSTHIGVVSADKMNILYIGVDNPISVAIADVPIEQTKVSVLDENVTLIKTPKWGTYHVRITSPGKITIRVEGTTHQGKTVSKELDFRGKRIPDPIAKLAGKNGGRLSLEELKYENKLVIELEDFDYDATFKLSEYEFTLARYQHLYLSMNKGAAFNNRTQTLLEMAEKEDVLIFENIRVRGPDGTTRVLPTLSFQLY